MRGPTRELCRVTPALPYIAPSSPISLWLLPSGCPTSNLAEMTPVNFLVLSPHGLQHPTEGQVRKVAIISYFCLSLRT